MSQRITDDKVAELVIQMRKQFLVPFDIEDLLKDFRSMSASLANNLMPPHVAFIDSILAVYATTTLPYQLAQTKANELHFQRFHMAARIRNLSSKSNNHDLPHQARDQSALNTARENFSSFSKSDDGLHALVSDLSRTLLEATEQPTTAKAANELLYQALIGLWSAFEVLVRDELIELLNSQPNIVTKLLTNPNSRKYFELPKISIDELAETQFDLSTKMENLLLGTRDFSDVRTIKAAFSAITTDPELIGVLNDDSLWQLNQCRHLIVHRRGIVDAKFKTSTSFKHEVGERIAVTTQDIDTYFKVTIQSATAFLKGIVTLS